MITDQNEWKIKSNGIPDHNACTRNDVNEASYEYRIVKNPKKKSGDQKTFPASNMGAIGLALNGVPIFNGYDSRVSAFGYLVHYVYTN